MLKPTKNNETHKEAYLNEIEKSKVFNRLKLRTERVK